MKWEQLCTSCIGRWILCHWPLGNSKSPRGFVKTQISELHMQRFWLSCLQWGYRICILTSPGGGRSPGEGSGNWLQYSCLWNPMERDARQATVHGVTKVLEMTRWLKNNNEVIWMFAHVWHKSVWDLQHLWEVVGMCVLQSCLTLCNPMDCSPPLVAAVN